MADSTPIELTAGEPVEAQRYPVSRRTTMLVDHARGGRLLGVEIWCPTITESPERTSYELFPGVAFQSAGSQHGAAVRPGPWPLVLFSHGRTGVRIAYSLACEALAARGAIVVSADHPGDALVDWLLGTHTDDATNESNRIADAHLVLEAVLTGSEHVDSDIAVAIDRERIAIAGHSYGAYTALATASGDRGVAAHPAVSAVIGFQPYTRTMSDELLRRLDVPALLVVASEDTTTPPDTNADRPWEIIGRDATVAAPLWRLDLAGASHQAISDISLYAEMVDHVPGLPDIVRTYLASQLPPPDDTPSRHWRDRIRVQVSAAWSFLEAVWGSAPQGAAPADLAAETDLRFKFR